MFCQVTWPIATGAAIVGSSPVGSTAMPMTMLVFAASAGDAGRASSAVAAAAMAMRLR